ncbi:MULTISPECIES: GFA family protein [Mesorhizobium]|uniref:GFA family protein n=1 Tax=Mesorhizobium TaxID=68287 RepID=UPI0010A95E14|nr:MULTISPECIES: GFA family protein [Mesorhizobium]
MKIDGGCHCGAITYEAEVDAEKTNICHCTDCQQLTGTAFRVTVPAPESNYRITKGTPKIYIKTVASGAKRAQAFCADCGSHLYATSVGDGPKVYGIRVGTARQREDLIPTQQKWHRSALHWLPEFQGMTTIEEQ